MADRPAHFDLLEAYRLHDDQVARDRLIEELMPLVQSLARRYAGRGEPVEDLVQVGAIGLIKAIDRFDLDRGVELSTYAVPTIVGEIKRHFRDRSWSVHVPRKLKELSLRVSRLVDELSTELGRSPTVAEIAAAADAEEEDVIEALETARAHTAMSLSTPIDASGELTLVDLLGEDELGYEALDRGSVVRTGLDALDERERRIIVLRFLHGETQSEIASELGISQMHVSRLLRKALAAMHGRINDGEECDHMSESSFTLVFPAGPNTSCSRALLSRAWPVSPRPTRRRSPTCALRSRKPRRTPAGTHTITTPEK